MATRAIHPRMREMGPRTGDRPTVLDGVDDYVEYSFSEETWSAFSVALWVKTEISGQDQYSGIFNSDSSGADFQLDVDGAENYRYHGGSSVPLGPVSTDWVHLAATCDGTSEAAADTAFGRFAVGVNRNTTNYFAGMVDDVRVYDRVLSAAEVKGLVPLGEATLTWPADGAVLETTSVLLQWESGSCAADVDGHHVYLSKNFGDVDSGAGSAFVVATSSEFYNAAGLDPGSIYYWRIHEVNDLHAGSPWKSEIRSFTVPDITAWDPGPADRSKFIDPDVTLSWQRGMGGLLYEIYLGESFEDVDAGTGGTYRGQQAETTYSPGPRTTGTVYFWRVDTVTSTKTEKGPVWSFTTRPAGGTPGDPNLMGWWKLDDDDSGAVAIDYSGYDRYGTLHGGAHYVPGFFGEAVEFGGAGDYISIDGYKGILGPHAFSVTSWIKTASTIEYNTIISWGTTASGARFDFRIQSDRLRHSQGNGNVQGNTAVNDGEWHHVGITVTDNATASSSSIRLYVDGRDDTRESTDTSALSFAAGADVGIGWRASNGDRSYEGLIDEVRLYDRVLSAVEVRQLSLGPKATNPSPSNGAVLADTSVLLSWTAGTSAASHNVYLGTDSNDLSLVAAEQPVDSNSFGPAAVDLGRTYYWVVDEVNDPCVWAGDLWSFAVEDYLVVDDFDDYVSTSGPNEPSLLSRWSDGGTNGTGSAISLADEFAGNSMKVAYDNGTSPFYSEAELVYDLAEDWTAGGVKAMALDFHGDVNNTGQSLYVVLEDADDNSETVTLEGASVLVQESWQTWNIALQDFEAGGVDATRVKKLVIGVSGSGGSGVVHIDEIQLHPPRCLPQYAVASFDGDCLTDAVDLEIVLRHWLAGDYDVVAVEPDDSRLQVHYRFDEISGNVANDSSGKGYDGTVEPNGADAWDSDGYDGYCLAFDGNFAVSVPDDVFAEVSEEVTISVWVHIAADVNPNTIGRAEFGAGPTDLNEPWDRLTWLQDKPEDYVGQWSHYCFVKAAGESMMRMYHNGILVAQNTEAPQPIDGAGAGPSTIGGKSDGTGSYEGKLDDFRVYDYALSHAEILYLALGSGAEFHQPLQPVLSPVDPYQDGMITFKDVSVLGEWWLRESLWP